ncbi:MAG: polysaccharide biosynthesis/export family protein, partial [Pseudomonadota bacterium]
MTTTRIPGFSERRGTLWQVVFVALLTVALPLFAAAQSRLAELTPEQQRALSQLPAAQRQALLSRFLGNGNARTTAQREDENGDPGQEGPAPEPVPEAEDGDPKFEPRDFVLVSLERKDEPSAGGEDEGPAEFERRLEGANPYRLDDEGRITLPGERGIAIAGLTEELAARLLAAVPSLAEFDVEVVLLPVQQFGPDALEAYGYDILRADESRRPQAVDIPVPTDYVLGPGDLLRIQLYGNQTGFYELEVDRDGVVAFPELGPINVAGLNFDAVRSDIERRVAEQLIGVSVSVTLGDLRSVQVFLAGDVERAGAYQVTAMSTLLDVLIAGGGIADTGSLRRIQLKRDGNTVASFDLYQLLLFGSSAGNRRVQAGDVVFVPPVGEQVTVSGAVRRPAIYEIRDDLDAADVLLLAGGAQSGAWLAGARLQRRDPDAGVTVDAVNLTVPAGLRQALQGGDVLVVPAEKD